MIKSKRSARDEQRNYCLVHRKAERAPGTWSTYVEPRCASFESGYRSLHVRAVRLVRRLGSVQTYEPVALAVAREAPESQLVAREPRRQRCEGGRPQAGDCKVPCSDL